ncbi:hypothetical protein DFQ14_12316 [Halopolyspora algeriensis]|uniref:DUF2071 domain-containing protein n=1 Tax=Halopolyspora algeriensis TaxID=1500506 RepID=A0A368VBA6_9ACTN|nr:DUF2071 domain-containing protein [Halopolyspora algeriensis]RCW38449.1 hypothetical protein DFQ14_12316 [Halopolyspora algeriensis]TQM55764.1 hypothetical protein FHU43_0540 [Halopolyspora algeriensis]
MAMHAAAPESITADPPPQPWPAPLGVALADVAFLHWPVEPAQVRPLLPPGTEPDTYGGDTHVGLVAFRMRSFGEFLETNVRVYSVDDKGRRGTVFLTMEADRLPWVVAARLCGLPYAWSRMHLTRNAHVLDYGSSRRRPKPPTPGNRIRIRVGPPIDGTPLEHFLTARWRLHLSVSGHTVAAPLVHDRWPLHTAELLDLDDQLIAATGLPSPTTAPASVLYAPAVHGRFGIPRPI